MEDSQVLYLGRWVSKEHFRTFIYSSTDKKLVKSYDDYCTHISSGLWHAEPLKQPELQESIKESEEENNIVAIKPKRGRKCQSQRSQ